jgi:predicted aspartyl protease
VDPIEWNGEKRVELPLTLNSWGSPMVPVQVMGHDTVALLDTGSTGSGLSRALATETGLQVVDAKSKVNGQKRAASDNVQVRIGAVSTEIMTTPVDDGTGPPFMLGMNLFLQAVVEMDFDTGRVTLIHPDVFEPPASKPLKVKLQYATPTMVLRVNGRENGVCVRVDTGYYSGLALTPEVIGKLNLPARASGGTVTIHGAFGFTQASPALAPVDNVQIGGLMYREVETGYAPSRPGMTNRCGNLLGMNVLYRHRVIFDLKNRRFWLLPRAGNQW